MIKFVAASSNDILPDNNQNQFETETTKKQNEPNEKIDSEINDNEPKAKTVKVNKEKYTTKQGATKKLFKRKKITKNIYNNLVLLDNFNGNMGKDQYSFQLINNSVLKQQGLFRADYKKTGAKL